MVPHDMSPARPMGGVLDCYKVACGWCSSVQYFSPPHGQAHNARKHATALGWRDRGRFGWICPKCVENRGESDAERAQITLPGFGHLSRNAGR